MLKEVPDKVPEETKQVEVIRAEDLVKLRKCDMKDEKKKNKI